MKYQNIQYEALDGLGKPYLRAAQVIHDLPVEMRLQACQEATEGVSRLIGLKPTRRIPFGAPAYLAFGLSRPEAKKHPHALILLTSGCDLSLAYCG